MMTVRLLSRTSPMPYKHADPCRHKFKKMKYKVTNWAQYNEALRQRGDINVWMSEEAINNWHETKKNYSGRGRPKTYSDIAVQVCLLFRQLYSLPLRQTQGFMRSLLRLMALPFDMMDFSNISKRSDGLSFERLIDSIDPGSHILVDSTGLKVYGQDEWHQEKHKVQAKRTWRKLHIAIDEKHQVLACDLSTKEVGDPSALPTLLEQIDAFDIFMADGAYDGEPSYQQIKQKSPDATCIIPPPKNAVKGNNPERNQHIEDIENHGRMGWQQKTNYGLRSHVELAMQRYKRIIGNTLKARNVPQQITEAQASVRLLNRMTQLGMPKSVRIE